jgi:hypothetical protein
MKSTTTITPMIPKIFMSVSPFFRAIKSSSTFKLILSGMIRYKDMTARGLPTSDKKLKNGIHSIMAGG